MIKYINICIQISSLSPTSTRYKFIELLIKIKNAALDAWGSYVVSAKEAQHSLWILDCI